MSERTIRVEGQMGAPDVVGAVLRDGVALTVHGHEEVEPGASLLTPETALRLGEWLIAQAIAQGAGRERAPC